jgi:hypothetical protein
MRWIEVRDLLGRTRRVNVEHIVEMIFDDRGVIVHTTIGQFGISREEFVSFERAVNQRPPESPSA